MFRFSSPVTLRLEPGETLALRRGPPARITVRAGVVHLTRHGDLQDHFLQAGEALDLHGSAWVVLEAARRDVPVLFSVAAPARWRLGEWLGRRRPVGPAAAAAAAAAAAV